jgi:serine O-acetyltransferase
MRHLVSNMLNKYSSVGTSRDLRSMKFKELVDADWRQLRRFAGLPPVNRPSSSFVHPRFAPVYIIRLAQRCDNKGWTKLGKLFSLLNVLLFSLEVPSRLEIGPGLVIPHPFGTVLGAGKIGTNVTIYQQVTLGAILADFSFDVDNRPIVEDEVIITAGAKIIGCVRLGHGSIIGANAVVLKNVPPNSVAVGVPATIKPRKEVDNVS